jgi:hypothetical protein
VSQSGDNRACLCGRPLLQHFSVVVKLCEHWIFEHIISCSSVWGRLRLTATILKRAPTSYALVTTIKNRLKWLRSLPFLLWNQHFKFTFIFTTRQLDWIVPFAWIPFEWHFKNSGLILVTIFLSLLTHRKDRERTYVCFFLHRFSTKYFFRFGIV